MFSNGFSFEELVRGLARLTGLGQDEVLSSLNGAIPSSFHFAPEKHARFMTNMRELASRRVAPIAARQLKLEAEAMYGSDQTFEEENQSRRSRRDPSFRQCAPSRRYEGDSW